MGKFGVLCSIAVAVLAFLLVVEAKILAETNDRILSGQRARVSQFPHQVSLRGFIRPDFAWHFCGGALINDRFVLTTANCMQGYNSTNVTINVGSLVVTQVGTMYAVSKITNHPQFNRKVMANDISVVKSAQRITFTNLVRPIRLPTSTVPDGYTATISGWGRFDNVNPDDYLSNSLLFKKTAILPRSLCIIRLGNLGRRVHENTLCTSNPPGRGICRGDFGSPLIHDRILIGLASWVSNPRQCARGDPDVYTRVFSHLQFIRNAMNTEE